MSRIITISITFDHHDEELTAEDKMHVREIIQIFEQLREQFSLRLQRGYGSCEVHGEHLLRKTIYKDEAGTPVRPCISILPMDLI